MRRPLLLTGGPAVGKTTCGRRLAEARDRAAFVDVDDLRHLVVSGHRAPWDGPSGRAQQRLGAENACRLVRAFTGAGFEAVVADVVTPETVGRYRELIGVVVVRLEISLEAALARARSRAWHLTDAEFRDLHRREVDDPPAADAVLRVDGLDVAAQTGAIERLWASVSP